MLDLEEAKQRLSYNPESGLFVWLSAYKKCRVGKVAGSLESNGYVRIEIKGVKYGAHRLAYLFMTGEWPPSGYDIDHINRCGSDNRWCNIRLATPSQNGANRDIFRNNKSGVKGVYFNRQKQKWHAAIKHDSQRHHLGFYESKDDAINARREAEAILLGKFIPTVSS